MTSKPKNPVDIAEEMLEAGGAAIKDFLKLESAGGILLMAAAALAILFANTGLSHLYDAFLETRLTVKYGDLGLSKPLLLWINDGLMAVFFLLVGMEIKRELVEGELSTLGQAVLPFFAAVGGVAIPALIYASVNWESAETLRGWAIPAATDIAFSLAILSLLGSRVPVALKIFLTAVAVIDDLCAIVIIAAFYTADISYSALIVAAFCLAGLLFLNLRGVARFGPYVVIGVILWFAVLKSGIHATVAGVILGFLIPLNVKLPSGTSMLEHMEHELHAWVAYLILPLFAFANSGVDFSGISLDSLKNPLPLGVALGLVVGKQVGIFFFSMLLIVTGFARLPHGVTWLQFYGVCIVCGIGFTMSLFIGSLAFEENMGLLTQTRLGVLIGSVVSGLMGYAVLRWATKPVPATA